MGNLSKTKKKRLQRGKKQAQQSKMDKRIEAETQFAIKQRGLVERHIAAWVRFICREQPILMLGWSYPKEPREGLPFLTLNNPAKDRMFVYGAPYMDKPDDIAGVKMAEEINAPCDVDIPTRDFSVPDLEVFSKGVIKAMEILLNTGEIYVGCMGGIGRTGLALAGLLKLHDRMFQGSTRKASEYRDFIRAHVHPHAIETKAQLDFIDQYDPSV